MFEISAWKLTLKSGSVVFHLWIVRRRSSAVAATGAAAVGAGALCTGEQVTEATLTRDSVPFICIGDLGLWKYRLYHGRPENLLED